MFAKVLVLCFFVELAYYMYLKYKNKPKKKEDQSDNEENV